LLPAKTLAAHGGVVSSLSDLTHRFVDELFELQPTWATNVGDHRFDDRWPDMSEAGRLARVAFAERWTERLEAIDAADLAADDRIDRDLLLGELAELRFSETDLLEEAWDPLALVYLIGYGLFPLTAREFAPLADRLAAVAGRLEGIPALLQDARGVLGSHPGRAVSRLHAEVAAQRFDGVAALGDEAVSLAEDAAASDAAVAALLSRLRAANDTAGRAIAEFGAHLREVVIPAASGSPILGDALFRAKLRHTLRDPQVTPEAILDRAEREFAAIRAEMVRLATLLWTDWRPGEPLPADEGTLVRSVLDAIAADHPGADEFVDVCRAELERIEAFCREHDVIGLADEPLEIRWTPEFLRSHAGAMLDAPGPLDREQKAFFSITPVRDEWSPEEIESYLREENSRQMQLMTIHEAVPGHYLQLAYSNRVPSLARQVFQSGVFSEGWAVYVTQVMLDLGFAGDDRALWLMHWKFYLRVVTNAILDVRIHTLGMTTDEAIALMVDGAFQERAEAQTKDERARLTATQLSTYFLGSLGMWDLEDEVRRRAADAAGAGRDAVPVPRVVGGYGDTPGFRYREHLERVISHGSPPIALLRRIVLGEA
jgi:uncharacterized protein (DUF885 family)